MFFQANSDAMARVVDVGWGGSNEKWRCLLSNRADVHDLSVMWN
jgi:hypothetical protein